MITIVGGGLAGLSLGVYLRKIGVEVKLYEAGKYPMHKVCGEFISGVSADALEKMGLDSIIADSTHHQKMEWWMEDKKVMSKHLPSVAWGISRYELDQKLAKQFKSLGGELYQGKKVNADDFDTEGLVISSGKSKKGSSPWIGLKLHVKNVSDDWISGLEMHVGNNGYLGLCEVESGRVNCCGLFKVDRSIKEKGSQLLITYLRKNGLDQLADRIESAEIDESSVSAIAGFSFGIQPYEQDFMLGDAAYLIPPFTGNGMSMAIESAHIAGILLKEYSDGNIQWSDCKKLYRNECKGLFKKRIKLAEAIHPVFFSKIGRKSLGVMSSMGVLPTKFLFKQLRTP